jgi:hypothetical protein
LTLIQWVEQLDVVKESMLDVSLVNAWLDDYSLENVSI